VEGGVKGRLVQQDGHLLIEATLGQTYVEVNFQLRLLLQAKKVLCHFVVVPEASPLRNHQHWIQSKAQRERTIKVVKTHEKGSEKSAEIGLSWDTKSGLTGEAIGTRGSNEVSKVEYTEETDVFATLIESSPDDREIRYSIEHWDGRPLVVRGERIRIARLPKDVRGTRVNGKMLLEGVRYVPYSPNVKLVKSLLLRALIAWRSNQGSPEKQLKIDLE
jgi:hypothetical protein